MERCKGIFFEIVRKNPGYYFFIPAFVVIFNYTNKKDMPRKPETILLSEFITRCEDIYASGKSVNPKQLDVMIHQLKEILATKGDIEIPVDRLIGVIKNHYKK